VAANKQHVKIGTSESIDRSDKPNPTVHHAANVPQLMAENGLRLGP
jgi:hypothetical protein